MKRCLLLLFACCLYAADAPPPVPAPAPKTQPAASNGAKFLYTIDPKQRTADWIQAYDLLKKDKTTFKVSMRLSSGMILANIVDLTAASSGTLLFVKVPSNTGPRVIIVPVEDLAEIFYSPA